MIVLAIIAVIIWYFTAPHGPGGPGHPGPPGPHGEPPRFGMPFGPLLTLVCSVVVLAVGAFITARWIVRPVDRLSTAMRAFGAGDLRVRSQLDRGDEIGELAKRFDEMAARIEALLGTEKELMANVAHELRTPLARIGVALDLATEGNSDRARASLTEIAVDVAELETIVNDILTALRVESAGSSALPLRKAAISPAAILDEAASRMRSRHPDRPLEIEPAAGLPEINVDPVLFRRVIDNLLENSHKYTPDRSAPIRVTATSANDAIVFEISDRGVGLSPDELPHLFEPFWRSERSRSRATGGVGLGLTLVKRIVDAHGAGIAVTSEVGAGTVARISVPLGR
jgi:signal transduction histidine kinase